MTRNFCFITFALAVSTLGSGCARGFEIQTPDGFAELDGTDDYRYRSTSAEGVVLAIRREKNEPHGSLAFWSSALMNELAARGYNLEKNLDVKSKDGTAGKQLRYLSSRDGRPNVLWVTVFVTDSRVVVVESGGDVAHFEHVEPKVSAAIEALDLS